MKTSGVPGLVVALFLFVACAAEVPTAAPTPMPAVTPTPAPTPTPTPTTVPTATPDLPATVQAAIAAALPTATLTLTPDIDATVEARIAATLAAIPTPTPVPTATPTPTVTPTPTPTPRPTATPTPRPTPTPKATATPTPTPRPTVTPTPSVVPLNEIVKQVRPAVVRIETALGTGSGAIFDTQGQTGYVITNYHVVEGSDRVNVVVNDSATYRGIVIGSDDVRDLAVVSICCGHFHKMSFGNASGLESGHEVVNIGYPLGMPGEATVTKGIVSAIRYDSERQSWVIQTDAVINSGNSGGPMLSMSGEVLGINTFKRVGAGIEGLGFAISEQTVQQRIPALRSSSLAPTPTPARHNPTPAPSATSGFGPISGELQHDPSDGFIKTEYSDVSFDNMVVEATFVNPYSSASNSWDYGFILRGSAAGSHVQTVVTADRRWAVLARTGTSTELVGGGTLRTFDTSAGGRNHLRVFAIGERGWLFVNGEFVSTFDMGGATNAGDVAVITGAYTGDEVAGAVTRFENFKGGQLTRRYGPANGKLQKEPGFIAEHDSGVWARDLVVEAEFVSPQGDEWDYGFVIRGPASSRLEVIGVSGVGTWFHYTLDVGDDDYTNVANGYLWDAGAALLSRNHLLLIAIEEAGWFFVNGQLVSKLDLGHNQEHGGVAAAGDFFLSHQGAPGFEDFNVWAP